MSRKIARNDLVRVIAGDHKGIEGRVLKVLRKKHRVVVEKVRLVKRHRREIQGQAVGGIVEMEAPIDISNVRLLEKGTPGATRGE